MDAAGAVRSHRRRTMRATLRRSCDSCAKAKHRCDLQTPRCSRCIKRRATCVYANEPLTSSSSPDGSTMPPSSSSSLSSSSPSRSTVALMLHSVPPVPVRLLDPANTSYDPFDSYPPTRLPRLHVQRLIHHFLSSIAFQYYPLDMNMETNPFIVSWWPLALEDPALFHVSLQTASLDEELRAQRGFAVSEALMVDSVSKLRKKIEHSSSALQDETINAVVTLAAIEHGKGNLESSVMHIDGVKQMISLRGGIGQVKQTSALTARMVLWVSMLVSCRPQFHINEDVDGDGVLPSLQWQLASGNMDSHSPRPCDFDIDPRVGDVLARLRYIFHETDMTTTELHDLTCFAIHKLLSLEPPSCDGSKEDYPYLASESLRYALVLYLLIVHGTTYYSHIHLATFLAKQLKDHLHRLPVAGGSCDSFNIWAVSIGMASSFDQGDRRWFVSQANSARLSLDLNCWGDVLLHLESILWLKTSKADLVWSGWQGIFSKTDQ